MPHPTLQSASSWRIIARSPRAQRGFLAVGERRFPCAVGRSGLTARKREGDGATPIGAWPIAAVLYRADRVRRPACGLWARPLRQADGWCDDVRDRNYNRAVRHPYPARAEHLWREDRLYDLVLVLGHNVRPRVKGLGSAIFMHLSRADYAPTAGCIALREGDLRRVLATLSRRTRLLVPGGAIKKGARSGGFGR